MEIIKDIINECVENFITKLEENILTEDLEYGKFKYVIYDDSLTIKYVSYVYSDGDRNYENLIDFNFYKKDGYPKKIRFWYDDEKKKDILMKNKIYSILTQRKSEKDRQALLKQNEKLISCLPEDRQKQIYRTAKLKRITKDEN